jgi:hypothetical protein
MVSGEATTFSTLPTFPTGDGEFPKNLKYLWNHPDLSQKTKEKIAYTTGRSISNWIVQHRRTLAGKRTEIMKSVESWVSGGQKTVRLEKKRLS